MSTETKRFPEQRELPCHGSIAGADRLNIHAAYTRIYCAVTLAWAKYQLLVQLASFYAPPFNYPIFRTHLAAAHVAFVDTYILWIEASDAVQL